MSLTLYYHPFASFCWKALIALYENDTPFKPHVVDLGDLVSREEFLKVWPIGKFPVLRDEARDWTVPESSIIVEYLAQHYPGRTALLPADPDLARQTRMRDRFFDLYLHAPMQKIVIDRLRPDGKDDPFGVEEARSQLATSYALIEEDMKEKTWAMGEAFTMADCAAAPALHYANAVAPFGSARKSMTAYLERLRARPSFARVLKEAEPYSALFPQERQKRA
jgi:glutathione S-transferase